ncbi:MAG: acyl-CoA dehydrogenase [Proteobacteria bacterium]|nr:acyl-CoA dehydrogenase [Pseudomonadota bacterium]
MIFLFSVLVLLVLVTCLGYFAAPLWLWAVALGGSIVVLGGFGVVAILFGLIVAGLLGVFALAPMRKRFFSQAVMTLLQRMGAAPAISETEKVAIEAGDTWLDKELFSGKINFKKVNNEPWERLSEEEQKFVDTKVAKLCSLVDDWSVYEDRDLPSEVWNYLKQEKFFGMIIPRQYGGLEFSAKLNSEVVAQLTSRSVPLAITVMVPNSLGPAELLLHYGTKEQKEYYLPRLADGREIPCFGLTETGAGSDAGSMQSQGVVFKNDDDGKIYIKLNWQKRYITLGAVATTLGLAVKLTDPDNLLGKGPDLGITCVLVDAKLTGNKTLDQKLRHDPLGVPFYNCPIEGHDVVVSIDNIIGGAEGAGMGWRMLMECLAAGRAISLPAQSTGVTHLVTRLSGAYGELRKQFGISIGQFEGVGEQLAHIGAMSYLMEAMRVFTAGAVDSGRKPAVVSAMAKYLGTEISREVLNKGMDVLGGAGISCGPRNLLGHPYMAAPIGITVEGANILTRSMIIFGQGALRCHPYAAQELFALADQDLDQFDKLFARHLKHVARNKCRAMVHSLTRGHVVLGIPKNLPYKVKRYYQKLAWMSSTFAFWSDVAMGVYGGKLKFKESITGRFADIFNWMYLITCVLRRFEAEGRQNEHLPFVDYAVNYGLTKIQKSFEELFVNLDVPVLSVIIRGPMLWWVRLNSVATPPTDKVKFQIAKALQTPGGMRDHLTSHGLYMPEKDSDHAATLADIDYAFQESYKAKGILRKIRQAIKGGDLPKNKPERSIQAALEKSVISQEEADTLKDVEELRIKAVAVDAFTCKQYKERDMKTPAA